MEAFQDHARELKSKNVWYIPDRYEDYHRLIGRDRQKSYLLDALSLVGVASLVRLSLTPLENYKIQCQASWLVPSAPKPSLQWQWNASYMYRGASLSVSRYAVSFIILRFVKDSAFAPVLLVFPGHTTNTPHFVATGIAAYVAHYLLYPIDVLRTHVAVGYNPAKDRSLRTYVNETVSYLSASSRVWYGHTVSAFGLGVYMTTTLATLLLTSLPFQKPRRERGIKDYALLYFLSGLSTFVGFTVSYPFDTIRRQLMIMGPAADSFKSPQHYIRYMVRIRGYKWMFQGYKIAALHNLGIASVMLFATNTWPGMISAYEIDDEVPLQKRSRFLEIDPDEESDNYWKRFYPDLRPLPVNFPRRQSEP